MINSNGSENGLVDSPTGGNFIAADEAMRGAQACRIGAANLEPAMLDTLTAYLPRLAAPQHKATA